MPIDIGALLDGDIGSVLGRGSDPEVRVGQAGDSAPWETLSLGPLRKRLSLAADEGQSIDLIYKSPSAGHEEVRVLPKLLTARSGREILVGQNVKTSIDRTWFLDRIVAVREVGL